MSKRFVLMKNRIKDDVGAVLPAFENRCRKYLAQEQSSLLMLLGDPFVQQLVSLVRQTGEILARRPPIYINDDNYAVMLPWLSKVDRAIGSTEQIIALIDLAQQQESEERR